MTQTTYHNPFADANVAAEYDSWYATSLGQTADRLEKALIYRLAQPRQGEAALDVGTGTGHYAADLARMGLRVTGVDRSEEMLSKARSREEPATWEWAEAESLPHADGAFQLVLCVTALEFMGDRHRALGEMWRVVAPGGRLVLAVLNAASRWGQALQRLAVQQDVLYRYAHFYEPAEFVADLSRYGHPRWSSSLFFSMTGEGLAVADVLEWFGQAFCCTRGALLVGRVDK